MDNPKIVNQGIYEFCVLVKPKYLDMVKDLVTLGETPEEAMESAFDVMIESVRESALDG